MTKNQKKLAIIKDALKQVNSEAYKPVSGYWAKVPFKKDQQPFIGDELQGCLLDNPKACKVCGLGSLFLSSVRLFDNLKIESCNLSEFRNDKNTIEIDYKQLGFLDEFFDNSELRAVEIAFERGRGYHTWNSKTECNNFYAITEFELYHKALKFGKKYTSNVKRMQAILKNMIKNKGTFKP